MFLAYLKTIDLLYFKWSNSEPQVLSKNLNVEFPKNLVGNTHLVGTYASAGV